MTRLELKTEGEAGVIVTRRFAAPPAQVYRAHVEPALLQRWCTGPDGWTMPVCISEPNPGGRIRFEWSDGTAGFFLTGEYLEIDPGRRIVHVERMHLPDPTPDNRVTTTFTPDGTGTLLRLVMQLPSAEARAAMLATGMDEGMEASYARLEAQLEDAA